MPALRYIPAILEQRGEQSICGCMWYISIACEKAFMEGFYRFSLAQAEPRLLYSCATSGEVFSYADRCCVNIDLYRDTASSQCARWNLQFAIPIKTSFPVSPSSFKVFNMSRACPYCPKAYILSAMPIGDRVWQLEEMDSLFETLEERCRLAKWEVRQLFSVLMLRPQSLRKLPGLLVESAFRGLRRRRMVKRSMRLQLRMSNTLRAIYSLLRPVSQRIQVSYAIQYSWRAKLLLQTQAILGK